MELTRISVTKRGRYALFIDGEFLLSLHEDIFLSSHLQKGQQVTVERLEELRAESDLRIAKDRALSLLSAKSYTAAQMREKLERLEDPSAAAQAVERLEELGLIDDRDYARRAAHDLYELKFYAPRRIVQELGRRGIEEWLAQEIVEPLEREDWTERLTDLADRRYGASLREPKTRQKAMNALLRLGYDREEVQRALRQAAEQNRSTEDTATGQPDGEEHDPKPALVELIRRKYQSDLSSAKGKQKVLAALLRQGHSYGDCKEAIAQVVEADGVEDSQQEERPDAYTLLQSKRKTLHSAQGRERAMRALLRQGCRREDIKQAMAQVMVDWDIPFDEEE